MEMSETGFAKMIDAAMHETLRDYSIVRNSGIAADPLDYFEYLDINEISKAELEIIRSFVGNVLIKYHVALQQSLKASGIEIGDLL
jgi:hypothetical protein